MCITVIDSLMGTGKTSWIIDVLNSELEKNFLYITPTLEETKRIEESVKNRKIYCPQNLGNGKIGNIANLLINQMDIASTHELFRRFDDKCKKALEENKYTLILDETLTAVEPYHFTGKDDYKYLLKNRDIAVNEDGLIEWIGSELDTRFDDVRILAKNKCLFKVDEKFFLWHFPHEIFTLFEKVYVLTYLFNGSKGSFIYLQGMGKAVASTIITMAREIIFGVVLPIVMPIIWGLDGILFSFPAADILTFIIAIFVIGSIYRELNKKQAEVK